MPLAIYGIVLIVAMLAWPSGIQGGVIAIGNWLRGMWSRRAGRHTQQRGLDVA
jgi:hypothetical protein